MTQESAVASPPVVTAEEWQRARSELLTEEKELTRALDVLAARRRRLPMVRFDNDYRFAGTDGERTLLDLFEGRPQLALYQFMDAGPNGLCPGCTWFTNQVANRAGLEETGVSWATVSDMPLAQIEEAVTTKGWTMPFLSSRGTTFAADCGCTGGFMLSLFLRVGDEVYRTYNTESRGVDRLLFVNNIQDLAPYGRQEAWEDSPEGWPQQ